MSELIKIIEGNILQSNSSIIVQQVNCLGRMGGGLAKQIMEQYESVKPDYQDFCDVHLKSGNTREELLGKVHFVKVKDGKVIANVFGQLNIRKHRWDKSVYTINDKLFEGISIVKNYAEKNGLSIAIPTYIGCGLANGDWVEIKQGIDNIFKGSTVNVNYYHYRKSAKGK